MKNSQSYKVSNISEVSSHQRGQRTARAVGPKRPLSWQNTLHWKTCGLGILQQFFWGPFDVCAWTSHLWDSCGCWVNRRIPESHKCRDSESLADTKFASKARFICGFCHLSMQHITTLQPSSEMKRQKNPEANTNLRFLTVFLRLRPKKKKKTVNTLRLKGFQKNLQGLPA